MGLSQVLQNTYLSQVEGWGTLPYAAPELLYGGSNCSTQADIWRQVAGQASGWPGLWQTGMAKNIMHLASPAVSRFIALKLTLLCAMQFWRVAARDGEQGTSQAGRTV